MYNVTIAAKAKIAQNLLRLKQPKVLMSKFYSRLKI